MVFMGYTATVAILMFLSTCWSGYALSILWGWFFVPTFGLPTISIPAAIGIAIVVGYMTKQDLATTTEDKTFAEMLARSSMMWATRPAVALGVGALVRLWM